MSDVMFEKLLDEYNNDYMAAEAYSRWMPPEGDYLVLLLTPDKGVSTQDDGSQLMWWRLNGQIIEEGTFKDRVFMVGYYTSKAFGFLKAATEALTGTPAKNLREADEILSNTGGTVAQVRVEEVYSKKHKQSYKNSFIERVLDTEENTDKESES